MPVGPDEGGGAGVGDAAPVAGAVGVCGGAVRGRLRAGGWLGGGRSGGEDVQALVTAEAELDRDRAAALRDVDRGRVVDGGEEAREGVPRRRWTLLRLVHREEF